MKHEIKMYGVFLCDESDSDAYLKEVSYFKSEAKEIAKQLLEDTKSRYTASAWSAIEKDLFIVIKKITVTVNFPRDKICE